MKQIRFQKEKHDYKYKISKVTAQVNMDIMPTRSAFSVPV